MWCQQVPCLGRAFRFVDGAFLLCPPVEKGEQDPSGLLDEGPDPTPENSALMTLITSRRPHLFMPTHRVSGFNIRNLVGTQTFKP